MFARFNGPAKLLALAALGFPQLLSADAFTSADVLGWSEAQQDALFQASVTMIGIVATRRDDTTHIARCIDDWYGDEKLEQGQEQIREALRLYPQHHPQAIIVAVIEKACGPFAGS